MTENPSDDIAERVSAIVELLGSEPTCRIRGDNPIATALRAATRPDDTGDTADDTAVVVIDTTGDEASILTAIESTPDLGTCIVTGELGTLAIDLYPHIHRRGITLIAR